MTTAIDRLLAHARRKGSLPPATVRRYLRQQAGLTQDEVAAALGVNRATVTRYESGTREPRGVTRVAYVEFLERAAE